MRLSRGRAVSLLIILLLLIDQIIKFAVKLNMSIGESIPVIGNWIQIYFIENKGMAFGMQFGGDIGKLLLSLFRIILIGGIIFYLRNLVRERRTPIGVIVGVALILAGAVGNAIDSLFYGMIFNQSTYTTVAELFPAGGGYSSFLHGKVVDMFYCPIIDTTLPSWLPIWGGEEFIFFSPIFNFADSCISVAVGYLLLFQRRYFMK